MAFAIPVLTTANNGFPMSLHNEEADVVQDARTQVAKVIQALIHWPGYAALHAGKFAIAAWP